MWSVLHFCSTYMFNNHHSIIDISCFYFPGFHRELLQPRILSSEIKSEYHHHIQSNHGSPAASRHLQAQRCGQEGIEPVSDERRSKIPNPAEWDLPFPLVSNIATADSFRFFQPSTTSLMSAGRSASAERSHRVVWIRRRRLARRTALSGGWIRTSPFWSILSSSVGTELNLFTLGIVWTAFGNGSVKRIGKIRLYE